MVTLNENIGRRIARVREARGITQGDLAHRVGLCRSQIAMIETGKSGLHVHTLLSIAKALKTRPTRFLPPLNGREQHD